MVIEPEWLALTLELTRRFDVSFYDAAYHALALTRHGTFVTADSRYVERTQARGAVVALAEWVEPQKRAEGERDNLTGGRLIRRDCQLDGRRARQRLKFVGQVTSRHGRPRSPAKLRQLPAESFAMVAIVMCTPLTVCAVCE
jgi:hypothetical protein